MSAIPGVPSTPQSPAAPLSGLSILQTASNANTGTAPEAVFPQPNFTASDSQLSVVPYVNEHTNSLTARKN